MKFNWGIGITIFIVVFMTFILSFIFRASRVHSDLYAEDYYEQELDYQNVINAKGNAASFSDAITFNQGSNALIIHFPEEMDEGVENGFVRFYRADDASQDRIYPLENLHGKMVIPKDGLKMGSYEVKIDWKKSDKSYLITKEIVIE